MMQLASIYQYGLGSIRPDDALAADWYERAAANKDPLAQYKLGRLWVEGKGRPIDVARGLASLMAAADQWNRDAQYDLGALYAQGVDAQGPNRIVAGQWFVIASSSSPQRSQVAEAYLATLTDLERDAVRDSAKIWLASHQLFPKMVDYDSPLNR